MISIHNCYPVWVVFLLFLEQLWQKPFVNIPWLVFTNVCCYIYFLFSSPKGMYTSLWAFEEDQMGQTLIGAISKAAQIVAV